VTDTSIAKKTSFKLRFTAILAWWGSCWRSS